MSVDQENPNVDSAEDDNLPDWLRQIRGDPSPESASESSDAGASTDTAEEAADLPDWLQESQSDEGDTPLPASDTPAVAEADDGEDLWKQILAEEGLSLDELEEDRPEGAEDVSVKDWMAATADESAKRQSKAQLVQPAQPKKAEPEPEPEPSFTAGTEDSGDDGEDLWKQILAEEGLSLDELEEDRPEGAEDVSVKDWMAATADESAKRQSKAQLVQPAQPKKAEPEPEPEPAFTAEDEVEDDGMVVEDELPDWLREDVPTDDGDAPSWLTDESVAEEDAEPEPEPAFTAEDEVEDDGMVVEDELPDWLREDAPTDDGDAPSWLTDESVTEEDAEPEPEPEPAFTAEDEDEDDGMVVEDELPDWLREDAPADDGDAPSWLLDESVAEEDAEPEPEPEPSFTAEDEVEDDGMVVEDELPDWLREDAPADDGDAPSWLTDESVTEEDAEPESEPAPVSAEAVDETFNEEDFIDNEGLPDWLQGDEAPSEAQPQAQVEPESVAPPVTAQQSPPSPPAEVEEDGIVDTEGLPDWLQGDEAFEDDAVPEQDVPAWLADEKSDSDAPDWLQTDADDDLGEVDIQDFSAEETDVPAWLEKVREESDTQEELVSDAEEAVESPVDSKRTLVLEPATAGADFATARAALEANNLVEAAPVIQSLINDSQNLDEVISSLGQFIEKQGESVTACELLGDAQMRNGQLNQALESYKRALTKL